MKTACLTENLVSTAESKRRHNPEQQHRYHACSIYAKETVSIERSGGTVETPASYPEGSWFKYRLGHRLS